MHKDFKLTLPGMIFLGMHIACLAALWVGVDWQAIVMCLGFFLIRKFGITGAYHRYFSHRSYKTGRGFQFVLAWLGGMSAQKGALWWAAHHRHHHKHSDTDEDLHSAEKEGFYWSHVGWILSEEYEFYDEKSVGDLTKYPELIFLSKHHYIPPVFLAVLCYLLHGWMGVVWGFVISTVILYHTTFAINSLAHMFGRRRYETGESSKNSLWLAVITLGEGWHNNHHHYPLSARQGFFWWEFDPTYYTLIALSWFGLVWDIKAPPAKMLREEAMTAKNKPTPAETPSRAVPAAV